MDSTTAHAESNNSKKEPVIFGKYAALIIDLLGQNHELNKFKESYNPYDKKDHQEILQRLKDTSGRVMGIAQTFESMFDEYIKSRSYDYEQYINDSTFNYSLYMTNQGIGVQKQYFSDTLLFYLPLFGPNDMVYVGRLCTLILTAAAMQIHSLAGNIPMRGAIDIGNAIYTPPIGLYGPLLSRIHHYESKVAGGPRIIVGDECIRFLENVKNMPIKNTYGRLLQAEASTTLLQVYTDEDGNKIVDFLSKFMAQISNDEPDMKLSEEVGKAHHFVNACKHKFRNDIQSKGEEAEKLYLRYSMMARYILKRKQEFWRTKKKNKSHTYI